MLGLAVALRTVDFAPQLDLPKTYTIRLTIICLMLAMASEGFSPFGQTVAQFMIV